MKHYFKNNFGDRGVAFVAWVDEWNGIGSEKYDTIEDLLNDCGQDYIPSAQSDYRKEVKMLLATYIWEIYKEREKLYEACGGRRGEYDGRKHARKSAENTGRLYAIRDIIRALGMDGTEAIGSRAYHYYDGYNTRGLGAYFNEDVENLKYTRARLGKDFYSYGFGEEE